MQIIFSPKNQQNDEAALTKSFYITGLYGYLQAWQGKVHLSLRAYQIFIMGTLLSHVLNNNDNTSNNNNSNNNVNNNDLLHAYP